MTNDSTLPSLDGPRKVQKLSGEQLCAPGERSLNGNGESDDQPGEPIIPIWLRQEAEEKADLIEEAALEVLLNVPYLKKSSKSSKRRARELKKIKQRSKRADAAVNEVETHPTPSKPSRTWRPNGAAESSPNGPNQPKNHITTPLSGERVKLRWPWATEWGVGTVVSAERMEGRRVQWSICIAVDGERRPRSFVFPDVDICPLNPGEEALSGARSDTPESRQT